MKSALLLIVGSIFLFGCSSATPEPIVVVVTAAPEPPTVAPENPPTNTPVPSPTAPPATPTSAPTEVFDTSELFARNYLGASEIEGVTVEVVRVLFGSAEAVSNLNGVSVDEWAEASLDEFAWTNMDVIGEVIIRYTNNRDAPVELAFGGCGANFLLVGGQQISFNNVSLPTTQNLCHEPLFPQSSVLQGVWFPIKNISLDDITEATLIMDCAEPVDDFGCIGSDWNIKLDLSEHRWEDLPDELK